MIYLILNILAFGIFIYYTNLVDSKLKNETSTVNSFAVSLLFLLVETGIFILVLFFKDVWVGTFINQLLKIALCFDALFLTNFCFNLVVLGAKKSFPVLRYLLILFLIVAIIIVFGHFDLVQVDYKEGLKITSNYLFNEKTREFFPWTWESLYKVIFRYLLPLFCYMFLALYQENKNVTQLEKYQTLIIGEGVLLMWAMNFAITFISAITPAFSLLFIFAYVILIVIIFTSLQKSSVPSGKGILVTVLKYVLSYLLPAVAVGFLYMTLQPVNAAFGKHAIVILIIVSTVLIVFSLKISEILSGSSKMYTADYESSLEKDLAAIDYSNEEMDTIIAKMYDNFRRNVEASSMNVYILNSQNELETAYSSNNLNMKIPTSNPIFDTLLNINKSVVISSEIESEHSVALIQQELKDFFEMTKSDALFILNEGHNIFGIITLGRKISGDHYKEYDYNVFVKLYSYFFVFGYYMRNISNKDIIGVVNREIKMSSQIITSIQENIDHIKNTKVDIGYLMVPAHNIGGEFIDLIRLTENRHLFVVGDLSGKGIAASMNMVILKSIIRTYLTETHDFKQLVVKVNQFVRESLQKGTIFAGLFALVDFETDTMYYINCGIPALMMYTQVYNNVIEIQGSGHVLGFVKDIGPYISVKTTKLNRGDIIFACTDGMIQSHSLRGEQFGKERLQQAMLDNSTYPAQRMAQFTFDGLMKFMSKEMEDDVSMLILKYESNLDYSSEETEKTPEAPIEGSIDVPEVDETVDQSQGENAGAVEEQPVEENQLSEEIVENEAEVSSEVANNIPQEEIASEAPVSADAGSAELVDENDFANDPDLPDLSDLDAMMKEAGL